MLLHLGAKVTVPAAIVSYFLLNAVGGNLFNQTGLQNTELGFDFKLLSQIWLIISLVEIMKTVRRGKDND